MRIQEKIVALHHSLRAKEIPHAFGGALALAWCTQHARGTIDIDVNIFVPKEEYRIVLDSLPDGVKWSQPEVDTLLKDGQTRIWWDQTPVDIFLNSTDLHHKVAQRCRWETFMSESIPFLSCLDLAVFKVFFNRTKDWADLEAMHAAGTLNTPLVTATIIEYLGADDERIARLVSLGG